MAGLITSIVCEVVKKVGMFSTTEQIEILTCVINSLKAIRNTLVIFDAHWREDWYEDGEDDAED